MYRFGTSFITLGIAMIIWDLLNTEMNWITGLILAAVGIAFWFAGDQERSKRARR